MQLIQNRRDFLASLSAAGAARVLGSRDSLADEGAPETTAIRLRRDPSICVAPWYIAEELLRAEGFTDVRYVPAQSGPMFVQMITRGELDFALSDAGSVVSRLDAGVPITALAGVHPGCFELFANERVRSILDLKGKSVGVQGLGSTPHVFLAVMATYVGLDPVSDINWVTSPSVRPKELFAEGKIDAFLGFPPEPQELRARKIGHVVLNSAVDRPWSQYFCCLLAGHTDFIDQHPIATKRVVRAVLKATDLCVTEPMRIAQQLVEGGSPTGMSMRSSRSPRFPIGVGGSTTRRTPYGSMPFGSTRRA